MTSTRLASLPAFCSSPAGSSPSPGSPSRSPSVSLVDAGMKVARAKDTSSSTT